VPTAADGGKGLGYEYFESLDAAVAYTKAQEQVTSPKVDEVERCEPEVDEDNEKEKNTKDGAGDRYTQDVARKKQKRDFTTLLTNSNTRLSPGDDHTVSSYRPIASTSTPKKCSVPTKATATEAQVQHKNHQTTFRAPIAAMTPPIASRPTRGEGSDAKTMRLGDQESRRMSFAADAVEKARTARAHAQTLAAEHATAKVCAFGGGQVASYFTLSFVFIQVEYSQNSIDLSTAQAAAEGAIAKAHALEVAAKAAAAAASAAEEAAAMASTSDRDIQGLPFLTLLKMVL
jgi:hypothetical protein